MLSKWRRITQCAVFVFMFVVPVLNLLEIYNITGTFYALNIGGLGVSDPAVILQAVFAVGELTIPLISAAILPILIAVLFGRIWCGWLCPYHLLSDAIATLRNLVIKKPAPIIGSSFGANITRFGFLILGTIAAGTISIPVLNYFSAPGILSAEAMILVKERGLSVEFIFIAAILILEFALFPRFWCRFFCPTGTVLSILKTDYTLHVSPGPKKSKKPCCSENNCAKVCPMGLEPYNESGNLLCTNCGLCVDSCKTGRLKFKGFQSRDDSTL
jgi:ferredoxin-type protein NapH